MNVNVLVPTPVLSASSDLQQSPSDYQPSVNVLPVNAVRRASEVPLTDSSCGHEAQQQLTPDEIRPASLLNQDQVNIRLIETRIGLS